MINVQRTQHQSLIKILIKNIEIKDENTPKEKILSYLARNYGGIFLDPLPIDEFYIANRLKYSKTYVKQLLSELNDAEKIFYRDAAIVKIAFLEPRDDQHIRIGLYRHFEKLQRLKWQRLQSIHYFIENDSICKSQLILRYFGEKDTPDCGICNICQPLISNKTLEGNDILSYLETGEKTFDQLYKNFSVIDKTILIHHLQELLDEEKINFKFPNNYSL